MNPINECCIECIKVKGFLMEDRPYAVKLLCGNCDKFGICNKCCLNCSERATQYTLIERYYQQRYYNDNNNNITYTIDYNTRY